MNRRICFVTPLLLLIPFLGFSLDGETNRLERFIERIQDSSPRVLKWQKDLLGAEYRYRAVLADKYPKLTVGTSADGESGYTLSNLKSAGAEEGEYETALIHSAATGLYITQELPTAGTISVGIEDSLSARIPESGDTVITQSPEISLTVTQPFAVNGKLIDPRLYSSKYDASRIEIEGSRIQALTGLNEAVMEGLEHLLNIAVLERQIRYTETKIGILEEELSILRLSEQQGRATTSEIWEKELERDTENEQLLQLNHSAAEKYFHLSLATGFEKGEIVELLPAAEELPDLRPDRDELLALALVNNPEIRRSLLEREAATHRKILAGASYGPAFYLSLSAGPRYAPGDSLPITFSDSVKDLGSDDGWTELSGTLGFTLPIYTGGKRKYDILEKEAAEEAAGLDLEERRRSIAGSIDLAFLQRALGLERRDIYLKGIELAEKQRDDTLRLVELKRSTKLDARRAEMQIRYREYQLLSAQRDIFLADLTLLDLAGTDISAAIRER